MNVDFLTVAHRDRLIWDTQMKLNQNKRRASESEIVSTSTEEIGVPDHWVSPYWPDRANDRLGVFMPK